jgi:hypothetical protein
MHPTVAAQNKHDAVGRDAMVGRAGAAHRPDAGIGFVAAVVN